MTDTSPPLMTKEPDLPVVLPISNSLNFVVPPVQMSVPSTQLSLEELLVALNVPPEIVIVPPTNCSEFKATLVPVLKSAVPELITAVSL